MKTISWVVVFLLMSAALLGAAKEADKDKGKGKDKPKPVEKRYGVLPDTDNYPQGSPKQALTSVLRAIDKQRIDYLMAHLADPDFVDKQVAQAKNDFEAVVKEARDQFDSNPDEVKQLRRFLKDGDITEDEGKATVKHPEIKNRMVYLRRIGGRWFMEDKKEP